jgi:hypothetical protein
VLNGASLKRAATAKIGKLQPAEEIWYVSLSTYICWHYGIDMEVFIRDGELDGSVDVFY